MHGETGWLADARPEAFADALARVLGDPTAARRMGLTGWRHVRTRFSRRAFGDRLENSLRSLAGR